MRQFDHIIWDWNGTIVNDTEICLSILNEQLRQNSLPLLNVESYRSRFCFPLSGFYKQIGLAPAKEVFKLANIQFIAQYNSRWKECHLHSGVKEVLEFFRDSGGTHSILSAYETSYLNKMVSLFGLEQYFLHIKGPATTDGDSKIGVGHELLGLLPYKKNRIIMVGDSVHDYEVAKALGVQSFLVSRGHQSHEKLSECNTVVLDSLEELLSYL